jgi:hypothetical protein
MNVQLLECIYCKFVASTTILKYFKNINLFRFRPFAAKSLSSTLHILKRFLLVL